MPPTQFLDVEGQTANQAVVVPVQEPRTGRRWALIGSATALLLVATVAAATASGFPNANHTNTADAFDSPTLAFAPTGIVPMTRLVGGPKLAVRPASRPRIGTHVQTGMLPKRVRSSTHAAAAQMWFGPMSEMSRLEKKVTRLEERFAVLAPFKDFKAVSEKLYPFDDLPNLRDEIEKVETDMDKKLSSGDSVAAARDATLLEKLRSFDSARYGAKLRKIMEEVAEDQDQDLNARLDLVNRYQRLLRRAAPFLPEWQLAGSWSMALARSNYFQLSYEGEFLVARDEKGDLEFQVDMSYPIHDFDDASQDMEFVGEAVGPKNTGRVTGRMYLRPNNHIEFVPNDAALDSLHLVPDWRARTQTKIEELSQLVRGKQVASLQALFDRS